MPRLIPGLALLFALVPLSVAAQPAEVGLGPDTVWTRVDLRPTGPAHVVRDGQPFPMTVGFPLWDADELPDALAGTRRYSGIGTIPVGLRDTLTFAAVVSEAPDNAVLVLAGRTAPDAPWQVYLDRNNDNAFSESEHLFTAATDDDNGGRPHKAARASATVRYDSLDNGQSVERELMAEVIWVQNNVGVRSTARHGGPLFLFNAEAALVQGSLTAENTEYAIALRAPYTGFYPPFLEYVELLVDRDGDGQFDLSDGSAERYGTGGAFELGGAAWSLDGVGPGGRWARFRSVGTGAPVSTVASSRPGDLAPQWAGVTLGGDALGSAALDGRYVLLDFWASWCSGCVAELPDLRNAVEQFDPDRLAVVGVATQDDEAAVRAFVAEREVTWPVVFDAGDRIALAFGVVGLPDPVLVGPDGRVVARGEALRGARLEETLLLYAGSE